MTLPSISFKVSKASVLLWSLAAMIPLFDAGFYLFALKPKEMKLASLEKEYQVTREAIKPVREDGIGIDYELKKVYDMIPGWEEFTRVTGEIFNKAESLNLLIQSTNYRSEAIKGSNLVKVTVSMPVTGSYGEIKRFIYELETSPRLFIIQDLSLGSGKTEEGDVSLSLTITAYFKG